MTTTISIPHPTHRLIPSQFPPIPAFDSVTRPDDLEAVMELEGWTNDRLVQERVARLPREQWVYGVPNASVVMAAFLHAAPAGGRFNSGELGAWYGAWALKTAIAEVAHHLKREAVHRRLPEMRLTYRLYTARLAGDFVDIRNQSAARPELYAAGDYHASQVFGEEVRRAGQVNGIAYDSLRHSGGVNTVAYQPRQILEVTQADHFDVTAPADGAVVARRKAF
ncbi:RES family NAD+ phosphorylase [Azospirillum melinis]|nr:hypothetical protein [Azospirillum melinis]